MTNSRERLQKIIAQSGVTSRRKAEELILQGKVRVNGKVVTELGTKASTQDEIEVNGIPLSKEESVYFLFYKPRGVISAVKDDKDRKVVTDFFPNVPERIFPVGRLDYDTTGVLLLTNDGDFAQKMIHPSSELEKVYIAKVKGIPNKDDINQLRKGVISDGEKLRAVSAKILSMDKQKNQSIIQVVLHEGRNRQVRRMLEGIRLMVQKLKRERFAFLTVDGLVPGEYRALTPHEVKQLRALAEKKK
ncbi:pseudouridine synthase [Bacillaceae bacterium S4-13-58]